MTKKQALKVLIENAAANVAGAGCGLRAEVTRERQEVVRDAIAKWYESAYGFPLYKSALINMGLPERDD